MIVQRRKLMFSITMESLYLVVFPLYEVTLTLWLASLNRGLQKKCRPRADATVANRLILMQRYFNRHPQGVNWLIQMQQWRLLRLLSLHCRFNNQWDCLNEVFRFRKYVFCLQQAVAEYNNGMNWSKPSPFLPKSKGMLNNFFWYQDVKRTKASNKYHLQFRVYHSACFESKCYAIKGKTLRDDVL